jgi:hypothetical protein
MDSMPDASAADLVELDQMIVSIRFEPRAALPLSYPEWRPETNGQSYQLFDSRGNRLGSPLRPVWRSSRSLTT